MLSLRNGTLTIQRLQPIHTQLTGHPHHVIHSSTDQRNGQTQFRPWGDLSMTRRLDLCAQLELMTVQKTSHPEVALAIDDIHLSTLLQPQNLAQVARFMILKHKATMVIRRLQPAGGDQQATSFRHVNAQPMPGNTLSGWSSTGQSSFTPPINSSSSCTTSESS